MFYKRPFVIVFIISLSWHLFWILAVSIVILPNNFSTKQYKQVNFLGALFKEIIIPSASLEKVVSDFNLGAKIETVVVALQPETKEDLSLKLKPPSESSPDIGEQKEMPDLLKLVSLPETNLSKEEERLELGREVKYEVSADGRAVSVNRVFTSADPEDDILKIRRIWQRRF